MVVKPENCVRPSANSDRPSRYGIKKSVRVSFLRQRLSGWFGPERETFGAYKQSVTEIMRSEGLVAVSDKTLIRTL